MIHHKHNQGVVILEFALIAPIIILILFAIIDIGNFMYHKHKMLIIATEATKMLAHNSSINQAESFIIKEYANSGITKKMLKISSNDYDPRCQKIDSKVSITIAILLSDLSITGNFLQKFTKNQYITTTITLKKQCGKAKLSTQINSSTVNY